MNLRRLSPETSRLASTDFLAALPTTDVQLFADFELELPTVVSLEALDSAMSRWRAHLRAGNALTSEHDAPMACDVRQALPLSPLMASDKTIWWWLSLVAYPDITLARWRRDDTKGLRDRLFGPCGRNALARLWWGAELVRGRSELVRKLFANQDLFEAVIGRRLGRIPAVLETILNHLADKPGLPARETVRDLQQVLSVVVLESLDPQEVGDYIDRLWTGAAGSGQ